MEEAPEVPGTRAADSVQPPAGRSLMARALISAGLIVVALVAGFAVFGMLAAQRKAPARTATVRPRTAVQVMAPALVDHREVLTGYGRARALRRTELTAQVEARVVWIAPEFEAGGRVDEGAVLARLDASDFEVAVEEARSGLAQIDARRTRLAAERASLENQLVASREELAAAERELTRVVDLAARGQASESEADRQRLQVTARRVAIAALDGRLQTNTAESATVAADERAAAARVRRAELDLARTEIVAPFAGVVEARMVQVGTVVGRGVPVAGLVDPSAVEIPILLPASRFGDVELGARAGVRLREDGEAVWTGQVERIAQTVDPVSRTFAAYVVVRGEAGAAAPVPPGAFVVGDVDGPVYEDVRIVPRDALVDGSLLVVEREDDREAVLGQLRPRIVATLADIALIDDGLPDGVRVVITNVEQVAPGNRVRIVTRDGEAGPAAVEDDR